MDDPLDITNRDTPYDRLRFGEAVREAASTTGFGEAPKTISVSYVKADPDPTATAIVEVIAERSRQQTERFTTAMREEGVPEETVQRILNRVQTGHPDGLEHWARVIGERYGSDEGTKS